MKKANIIFEENSVLTVKFQDPRFGEYLSYLASIKIKDSGKTPVEITIKFDDIPPDNTPMPPEEHTIKATNILELYTKLNRWFGKWVYRLQ